MTIDEYAQWAASTPNPDGASRAERLAYIGLGLAGEAGEVADTIRRSMRDGSLEEERLIYELGDLVYHWACLCSEMRQSPSALLARSRQQIEARLEARKPPTAVPHS